MTGPAFRGLVLALVATLAFHAAGSDVPFEAPVVDERLASGVPLGGIGCGKLELRTDATFARFTGNTNWDRPVEELPGSCFVVRTRRTDGREVTLALAGGDPLGVPSVHRIVFDGRFPAADVRFEDPRLGCAVELFAFSPFVPGDVADSSVPGALFRFRVVDPAADLAGVDVELSFDNVAGLGGDSERAWDDPAGARDEPFSRGVARGRLLTRVRDAEGVARNPLSTLALATTADVARDPAADARLDRPRIAARLRPGDDRADLALAWHAPFHVTERDGRDHGKAYLARYGDAADVASDLLSRRDELERRTRALERTLEDSTLPQWLVRKLLIDLAPMVTGTVLTRDGWFGLIESPVTMRGALGTMDQRLCAHAGWTFLFPELDRRELVQWAGLQLPRGDVPHFSGNLRLALDSATVPYGLTDWPDLPASFVIQVDAFARWSGDRAFLEEMAPHVRRAVHVLGVRDSDGDGVPEGGSTFDNRVVKGTFVFHATVTLAALLAGERVGRLVGDEELASRCRTRYRVAKATLERELWNGRWFDTSFDPATGKRDGNCFLAQLAGDFRARVAGLGPAVDPAMGRRAIRSLLDLNGRVSRFVPPLDATPDGRLVGRGDAWAQYTDVYLYGAAIQHGFAREALDGLRRFASARRNRDRNPFDTALVYDGRSGRRKWGGEYMTSPASWFLPRLLVGFDVDRLPQDGATLVLDPRLPPDWTRARVPVFSPGLVLDVTVDATAGAHRRWILEGREGTERINVRRLVLARPAGVGVEDVVLVDPGRGVLTTGRNAPAHAGCSEYRLDVPLRLEEGARIELLTVRRDAEVRAVSDAVRRVKEQEAARSAALGPPPEGPVSLDLAFEGNPLEDAVLHLVCTVEAHGARAALDRVEIVAPAGIDVGALRPAGEVLVPGVPWQRSVTLDIPEALRWRRDRIAVEIAGRRLVAPPVAYRARASVSVGYDFVTRFLVRRAGEAWAPRDTRFRGVLSAYEDRAEFAAGAGEETFEAAVDVLVDEDVDARLLLGSGGATRVDLAGERVFERTGTRFAGAAQDVIDVRLRRGRNRLDLAVTGGRHELTLLLEIVDRNDRSIPGLRTALPGE